MSDWYIGTISHRLDYTPSYWFYKITSSCDKDSREQQREEICFLLSIFFHSKLSLCVVTAMYEGGWKKTFSISNQFQSTKVSRKWTNFPLVGIDFPHNIKRRATSFFIPVLLRLRLNEQCKYQKASNFILCRFTNDNAQFDDFSLPHVYQHRVNTAAVVMMRETENFESIHLRARVTFSVLGGV